MYFPPKTTRKSAEATIKCAAFTRSWSSSPGVCSTAFCSVSSSDQCENHVTQFTDSSLPAALHLCQCNPLTYFHQWNGAKILGNVRKDERVATQHLLLIAFIICWNISLKSKSFRTPYIYLCDSALMFLLKLPLWPTASLKAAEKTTLIRFNTVLQGHQHYYYYLKCFTYSSAAT